MIAHAFFVPQMTSDPVFEQWEGSRGKSVGNRTYLIRGRTCWERLNSTDLKFSAGHLCRVRLQMLVSILAG